VDQIIRHARERAPEECCGVLLGLGDRVDEAVNARNIADRPDIRFLIDPRDHLEALRRARRPGLDVPGFYRSRPRWPAIPSARDLAEASYPNHLFLIVGLQSEPPDVRLYRFRDGNFLPVPFVRVR